MNEPSDVALLGASDVRALAERLGVRPTKTLGQNFVHDAGTVRRIVRAAGVQPGDRVLEIGPGLGSLTLALLEAGADVVAVEIDPVLAAALPATVAERAPGAADRFEVVLADAMRLAEPDLLPGAAPTRLVANLPYNVAVPVLLTALEHLPTVTEVLVMVQAEVADRLAAPPGSRTYGVPSAKAAWWTRAERAGTIGRQVFWPVPNVDSALVRLTRRPEPVAGADRREVFAVVDAAFAQRRKTLRSALAGWAGSPAAAEEALRAAGVDPSARGETLTIVELAAVAAARADAAGTSPTPEPRPGASGAPDVTSATGDSPTAEARPGASAATGETVTEEDA
ncbi:16S rRNA (adenine(1518)-N(6)/adenine(1519)-N(6))-dimethyltransferase RsmA [Georgenia sp. Z1344]|uniref:16S rRNA (adenine(1518)-N(6)/adenine(1519)-N(6))- dimethyltransferase RsmA n=1 Tax=Georgenia sp. Z1344 TaxID=3416706 RepID=UPI003CE71734